VLAGADEGVVIMMPGGGEAQRGERREGGRKLLVQGAGGLPIGVIRAVDIVGKVGGVIQIEPGTGRGVDVQGQLTHGACEPSQVTALHELRLAGRDAAVQGHAAANGGDHIAEAGGHVVREVKVGAMHEAGRDVDLAKVLRGHQSAVLPHAGANEVAEKAVKDVFVTDRGAHGRHLRTAVGRRASL